MRRNLIIHHRGRIGVGSEIQRNAGRYRRSSHLCQFRLQPAFAGAEWRSNGAIDMR